MYARTKEGPWVLYDLERDPYERTNRAEDTASAPLRSRMQALLDAWMIRTGDSWALNSMEPVEDKGRLYRFGTFTTIDAYLTWAKAHPEVAPKDSSATSSDHFSPDSIIVERLTIRLPTVLLRFWVAGVGTPTPVFDALGSEYRPQPPFDLRGSWEMYAMQA